ncbi:MAG: hypothetical protein RL354_1044, partial [Planctomycetota bacterium]
MNADGAPVTILDLFDRARAAHGPRTALEIAPANDGPAVAIDYDTLDAMADEAAALLAPFAAADAVIALTLPRSDPWLYACMLGVMRTGAAYVAIDPAFPARQAVEILDDAAATVLVARPARAAEIAAAGARAPTLDPPGTACATVTVRPFRRPHIAPTSLAYVIYTSGTTGKPKGVEVEHRSILNLVYGDVEAFGLGARERVAQGSSASYDSSIEEIWLAWAVGGAVVVMDDETARLGPDLLPWLVRRRITVLCPPPTLLRTLACGDPQAALPELRLLYVGGEALPPDLADLWSRGRRLENGYGPTECTVTCLRATVRPGEPVTIGRAIPGSTAFVIDADDPALRVIEDDAHGELVVGGASLARGYRGQPETTAARFIDHPRLGRVYRTGDLVHRDADGAFHYHGRIDAQVKLRGYRVELGAVEARLAAHPSVIEAACTVEGEGTQRRLVAHVVLAAGAALDAEALRAFVADALPRYMVPAAIAPIAAVPRSIGGKLDRKRLPRVGDVPAAPVRVAPPEGELERLVAEAIAAVLARPVETVSADADFFDELGLDSLTVAMAISRLRANAATRAATVRLAYAHRTVRAVAQALGPTPDAEIHRTAATEPTAHGVPRPLLATTLQALFLAAMLVAGAQLLWIPDAGDWLASGVAHPIANAAAVAIVGAVAVVAYSAGVLLLALSAKWLLIGRYRPARVRAWSMWHLRHWIVVRLAALAPWDLFELVGAAPAVLQLFGARIGSRVHIHRGVRLGDGGWDLLTLEDDATVGQDACLRVVELEAGCLVFGTVTVRRTTSAKSMLSVATGRWWPCCSIAVNLPT